MGIEPADADLTLAGLKRFPAAITTMYDGRSNGLMSLSLAPGSIVPEAARALIGINKYNHTHDMIVGSGVFVAHLLGNAPELIDDSLAILMALGGSSGRDGDKLGGLKTRPGVTGAPVLERALSYVECRVVNSMDGDESTFFLADVVAGGRLSEGGRLSVGEAWAQLPSEWIEQYDDNHHGQLADCRRRRG
jgi:flavin reductase (DIM6/NTAB) family NADH-FMN oxidoreductase RutF